MLITNPAYLVELKKLKHAYAELPWYQRLWFSIWSYRLSRALSAIELENPTNEQIQTLYYASKEAWFFKSIFELLKQFKQTVLKIPFVKERPFKRLPEVLNSEIGNDLTAKELLILIQSSKTHAALYQPILHVRKLLYYVTRGKYDAVEAMLKKDIHLLTKKGSVTDYSGRSFSNISGFEYALWALDKHMWARMRLCLPKDEQGEQIKASLTAQYKGIKEIGVTYTLIDQRITEKHFDFANTIIKELQTQVDSANDPNSDWEAVDRQWRKGVGRAQRLLPTHVVYEYCSEEPFYPLPSFTKQPTLNNQFYNWLTGLDENWFHPDSKLSIDFAIYRGGFGARAARRAASCAWAEARHHADLAAVTALCDVRTNDFIALESQLEEPLNNTPSSSLQM